MAEAFLSGIWYRVRDMRPRLRPHVGIARHRYRGRAWYVLQDHATGRQHRFTPPVYMLLAQFDGRRTVDEIWQAVAATGQVEAPSQDEVIRLLSQLHQSDLIQYEGTPDVAELLDRYDRQRLSVVKQNLTNPLSFRIPLVDPDAFLDRTLPLVRWLTGWIGLVLWVVVVGAGLVTAGLHWDELSGSVADRLLATENLVIMALTYPVLKLLHELGHGWLAKARGAEVRDMGLMILVLFPTPYVDASATNALPSRWQRAAVSAGGVFVETFVAAVAVMVWASVEPGLMRAVAFNLAVIGGLSTVLINGNPLLKFDGYYVFSDLIEVPNLATRANRFWGHLMERYVFGARSVKEEVATWGERVWFVLYAPAAFVYRIVISVGIALYIGTQFFVIGVLLALWALFTSLVKPAAKALHHVVTNARLRKVRRRAVAISFGGLAAAVAALALLPAPSHTDTEGVIWLPDEATVRARTAGFVAGLAVPRGAHVAPGDLLARLEEPTLAASIEALRWQVREYERRLAAAEVTDRAEAEIVRSELAEMRERLAREMRRQDALAVRSLLAGVFEPAMPAPDVEGRFLAEGDVVGWVVPPAATLARIVVPQDDIALVRERLRGVELKLAGWLEARHAATVLRAVPAASGDLPSPALATGAGGRFMVDPTDRNGRRALEPVFVFDLALPPDLAAAPFGARVHVRFAHVPEPAAAQIWRRVRQLLLRQFDA
jgi:putative peptide zinc metalloprotease protein